MSSGTGAPGCDHGGLAEDLRAAALQLLDRLQPAVERLRAAGAVGSGGPTDTPASCAACPVCALITALRGERPELAGRIAEHTAGLLAVLRAALVEGAGSSDGSSGRPASESAPSSARRVQHITVRRG
ncbi:hypothetical protein [Pseudonocardia asaccharolytica]|uniref:Uncharacterized protein n=1 Tax=Pseudonocardia asaccharolytica DSM 44247 = NBRC 16224 TaxID=1123024 RepID=A0A511CX79_9PSEU|nr:hypothetical protein [Pseudonocardia asaccharolytica]GEL17171.1 hypothetical protein PA7_10080 [Pseudonocardia asaccharolytica DSM 44247 = NBRC 16224]